jgi:hypothetical protein
MKQRVADGSVSVWNSFVPDALGSPARALIAHSNETVISNQRKQIGEWESKTK